MNRKEQKRLKLLNDLEARTTTVQKTSELLGLSLRHVYRLQAPLIKELRQFSTETVVTISLNGESDIVNDQQ
ncbi:MAG: hypothetical protein IH858_10230 [Chloroflexi bacterium]|nr:hypothetical protein [Chloroflexota bacterium]